MSSKRVLKERKLLINYISYFKDRSKTEKLRLLEKSKSSGSIKEFVRDKILKGEL